MPTLHDPHTRAQIVERIRSLTGDEQRQWGTMDVAKMLAHAADQLRMAIGDVKTGPPRGALRFAPTRFLLVHVLPWPKGRATAPVEAFTTPPLEFAGDRSALVALVERFGQCDPKRLARTHPIFGPMTAADWGVLSWRHLDHHLRQFGG